MLRVIDVVRRLFPAGTTPGAPRRWASAPFWPPDVFALSATLVNISGCYSRARYSAHWLPGCFFDSEYRRSVREEGTRWGDGALPNEVTRLWQLLIAAGREDIHNPKARWCDHAMKLMALADEASAGIGFVTASGRTSPLADFLYEQHRDLVLKGRTRRQTDLPHLPVSLCWMIPPSELCVQPKARTAQVGCTLRSLSHHLALLPASGEITTSWMFASPSRSEERALNLLLVPFPFRIDGSCFVGHPASHGEGDGRFFDLRQDWLSNGRKRLQSSDIGRFLAQLVQEARREVHEVHGVVLPETAVDERLVKPLARYLASHTGLELFIAGVSGAARGRRLARNSVYTARFHRGHILTEWMQPKHHRWRLDRHQIRRYHLGDALDPEKLWWERIELQPRTCTFHVFRHGACLAALVCEDLARIDPVQTALRAVGPNLVVVLLLDGPQRQERWPGKYATVLADDPGSAVLTLTSAGMIRRSVMPGEALPQEIALWKDADGVARELRLPHGSHGVLLTISQADETNYCLDGRSDNGGTVRLALSAVRDVKHPSPPAWLDSPRARQVT